MNYAADWVLSDDLREMGNGRRPSDVSFCRWCMSVLLDVQCFMPSALNWSKITTGNHS